MWCVCGVYVVCVCGVCACGVCVVCVWCVWCVCGVYVVCVVCVCGVYVVCVVCVCVVCMCACVRTRAHVCTAIESNVLQTERLYYLICIYKICYMIILHISIPSNIRYRRLTNQYITHIS